MSNIIKYAHEQFGQIRICQSEGKVLFLASDVAKGLGFRDAYSLTRTLDNDEKGTQIVCTLVIMGSAPLMLQNRIKTDNSTPSARSTNIAEDDGRREPKHRCFLFFNNLENRERNDKVHDGLTGGSDGRGVTEEVEASRRQDSKRGVSLLMISQLAISVVQRLNIKICMLRTKR